MAIPTNRAAGLLLTLALIASPLLAQTKGPAAPKAKPAPAAALPATLAQLMKGIFFPNSNVVFAAQDKKNIEIPPADDASTAVNPLASAYGKWEAVENSSLALAEASRLLTVPGRKCSNGRPVPMNNPDWAKLVQGMRQAGLTAYKAAQSKDEDKILDAADVMATACANCHDKYREVEVRCK